MRSYRNCYTPLSLILCSYILKFDPGTSGRRISFSARCWRSCLCTCCCASPRWWWTLWVSPHSQCMLLLVLFLAVFHLDVRKLTKSRCQTYVVSITLHPRIILLPIITHQARGCSLGSASKGSTPGTRAPTAGAGRCTSPCRRYAARSVTRPTSSIRSRCVLFASVPNS